MSGWASFGPLATLWIIKVHVSDRSVKFEDGTWVQSMYSRNECELRMEKLLFGLPKYSFYKILLTWKSCKKMNSYQRKFKRKDWGMAMLRIISATSDKFNKIEGAGNWPKEDRTNQMGTQITHFRVFGLEGHRFTRHFLKGDLEHQLLRLNHVTFSILLYMGTYTFPIFLNL